MFATKIAMMMIPNKIHMTEKIRATTDFGDLSPYLMDKKSVNDLKHKIAEHKSKHYQPNFEYKARNQLHSSLMIIHDLQLLFLIVR